jgi:hypothetical protein
MSDSPSVVSNSEQLLDRRRQGGGDGDHPQIETLYRYHRETLTEDQADAIQGHLAGCPACARLFLGLVNFLEWDLDPERLSVEDITRSWERFLERVRPDEALRERELCPVTPG